MTKEEKIQQIRELAQADLSSMNDVLIDVVLGILRGCSR